MVEVMKKVSEKYEENVKAVRKIFPKALVFDVTLDGAMKRLDPVFPLGKIEIPGSRRRGLSLMSVWEGAKVFKKVRKDKESGEEIEVVKDVDVNWMMDEKKLGKVRGCKSWGSLEGIRMDGRLMDEDEGREFFKGWYEEIIRERFGRVLEGIKKEAERRTVVLLDYKEEVERPFNHVEVLREMVA